jgi:hypothetical protein
MPEPPVALHYVYVLVRTDLPLADQIVQVGHACLEAGRRFHQPQGAPHLVVLSVRSQAQLRDAVREAEAMGVRCVLFDEPDDAMGHTAACTGPITGLHRPLFRRFRLWEVPFISEPG